MFLVTAGTIEIIRTTDGIEQLVVTFGPGMFWGEGAMLTGRPVVVRIRAGAVPCTAWLNGCIALDAHGFIKTGPDLTPDDLAASLAAGLRAVSSRDESARHFRRGRRARGEHQTRRLGG